MRETIYEGTTARKAKGEWRAYYVWENPRRVDLADEERYPPYFAFIHTYCNAVVEFEFTEAES